MPARTSRPRLAPLRLSLASPLALLLLSACSPSTITPGGSATFTDVHTTNAETSPLPLTSATGHLQRLNQHDDGYTLNFLSSGGRSLTVYLHSDVAQGQSYNVAVLASPDDPALHEVSLAYEEAADAALPRRWTSTATHEGSITVEALNVDGVGVRFDGARLTGDGTSGASGNFLISGRAVAPVAAQ